MPVVRFPKTFGVILIFLIGAACTFPARLLGTAHPTAAPPTHSAPTQQAPAPTRTAAPGLRATTTAAPAPNCAYNPALAAVLQTTTPDHWIGWIRKLSGADLVEMDGRRARITTRYSPAMFSGQKNAQAFPWVRQQILQWYPPEQVQEQPYTVELDNQTYTWKNLILTLPGASRPDEIVILAAHLDSTSQAPLRQAPGAEDNGSGSAALLEAARLFHSFTFERTLQIVWFTGEEQGLLGSQAFAQALDPAHRVVGVINLDMFGYDSDGDRCFELHVGRLPASQEIGTCFTQSIHEYDLDLTYDYLTDQATSRSDHGSFWSARIGAVEVLQDLFESHQENGCRASDPNPYYHTTEDTVEHINPATGFAIVQAALATAAALAVPQLPPDGSPQGPQP